MSLFQKLLYLFKSPAVDKPVRELPCRGSQRLSATARRYSCALFVLTAPDAETVPVARQAGPDSSTQEMLTVGT
jgi:hypothetical protein